VFVANGYINGTASSSAVLSATSRNPGLGNFVEQSTITVDAKAYSSSTIAGPHVLRMRLKYGALLDDHTSNMERREAGNVQSSNIEAVEMPGQVL
jgi:hypothetical protein